MHLLACRLCKYRLCLSERQRTYPTENEKEGRAKRTRFARWIFRDSSVPFNPSTLFSSLFYPIDGKRSILPFERNCFFTCKKHWRLDGGFLCTHGKFKNAKIHTAEKKHMGFNVRNESLLALRFVWLCSQSYESRLNCKDKNIGCVQSYL